jgi:hypothetical protein
LFRYIVRERKRRQSWQEQRKEDIGNFSSINIYKTETELDEGGGKEEEEEEEEGEE